MRQVAPTCCCCRPLRLRGPSGWRRLRLLRRLVAGTVLRVPDLGWRQLRLLLLLRPVVAALRLEPLRRLLRLLLRLAACAACAAYGWRRVRPLLRLVVDALLIAAVAVAAPAVAASGGCGSGSYCVTAAAASAAVPANAADSGGFCRGRRRGTAAGAIGIH